MQNRAITMELDRGWKFCNGDVKRWERINQVTCYMMTKTGFEVGDMDIFLKENSWREVSLPHDWSTEQDASPNNAPPLGFKPRDKAWYYNEVMFPEFEDDAAVFLEFEGVMGECVVYVNGVLAARSESGYTGFCFEISDYVLPGEVNTIVVSVDNTHWEGWWYEGAGIYRPVKLHIKPAVHFSCGKTFIHPELHDGVWTVHADVEIENSDKTARNIEITGKLLNESFAFSQTDSVEAYTEKTCTLSAPIESPKLWSPDSPSLYTMEFTLNVDGVTVEQEQIRFGFRDIQWTDHGMYLNGVKTVVKGVCCHQDHAGVGVAITKSLTRYRIATLKRMGVNAYRCAHHAPSRYLLEVCDELGILVMAENRHFRSSEEVMQQLDALTLLCRNHPSVFLYSLFNEERWQSIPHGVKISARMIRRIRKTDPTRPITAAISSGILAPENASDVLDVAGLNYNIDKYMQYAERRPGHPLLGTENGPIYGTRGIYQNDKTAQVYDCYGLNKPDYFGQTLPDTINAVRSASHVAGLFVWGGLDYRGEPQPFEWPSVFSHWGLQDCCGFIKDTGYMLKSYYDEKPMLHLLPHWNWTPGETVRVCAMTNCESVQLYVNGRALESKTVADNRAEWEVPFEPGYIRAVAVCGDETLTDEVHTAGAPAQLVLTDAAPEEDYDSVILNVALADADGITVPRSEDDREVRFEIHAGKLIGSGNGDPNGVRPDTAQTLSTFHGLCQAVIYPDADGKVRVTVHCDGMKSVEYSRG